MYDFHDEELVEWRSVMLGSIENFYYSNILSSVPKVYNARLWIIIVSISTISTIACSFMFRNTHIWISGMLGNISAGLIASLLILFYTLNRDKNISYYESLFPTLVSVINDMQRAFDKLYFLQHDLRSGRVGQYIENYNIFAMKVFLSHKALMDLYKIIKDADAIKYQGFHFNDNQINAHNDAIEYYKQEIAINCSKHNSDRLDEFDSMYNNIWSVEMNMMRDLHGYIEYIRSNIYTMKFGKK